MWTSAAAADFGGRGRSGVPALRVGRRVRSCAADLDQLLADAEEPSRVEERTVSD
jgi:hypothetical protein